MNNLVTNFSKIEKFAQELGVPLNRKRAVVREFLQTKFIVSLYLNPKAKMLSFVGGTSLRLLRDLDRFSEDLDFDNLGLKPTEIKDLALMATNELKKENIKIELTTRQKNSKQYFQLKFPELLYQLGISTNPREKLMIKIDYADLWKGQKTEVKLMQRYGMMEQVVTNIGEQLLGQKLTAYGSRPKIQPRDIYDIVWLYSLGLRLDKKFLKINGQGGIVKKALEKFSENRITRTLKKRLEPFLFQSGGVNKLDLFESVLHALGNE